MGWNWKNFRIFVIHTTDFVFKKKEVWTLSSTFFGTANQNAPKMVRKKENLLKCA
jgi:hypothetical protein